MRHVTATAFAAVMLGALALAPDAHAAPAAAGIGSTPSTAHADSLLLRARGCHRDRSFHYSEFYGRRIWHRHVGRRCRAEHASPPRGDFHSRRDSAFHSSRESRFESRHRRSYSRRSGCTRVGPVTVCD